jgi:hypothetical protein
MCFGEHRVPRGLDVFLPSGLVPSQRLVGLRRVERRIVVSGVEKSSSSAARCRRDVTANVAAPGEAQEGRA